MKEKAAYLKGLIDGLGIDETTKEGKVIKAMSELLGELAEAVDAIDEDVTHAYDQINDLSEELEDLEADLYEDDDTDDDDEEPEEDAEDAEDSGDDDDNPVYYVQYAHARICSILKKMESEGVAFAGAENIDATLLTEPSEMDLIRMLAAFPQEIVMAAEKYDPSRINRFVIDLASAFHRFYGSCRIQGADPAVQQARLALCIGVKNVIFNVLTMFKINVPEKM